MSHKRKSFRGESCHCAACEIAKKKAYARRVGDLVAQDIRDIFEHYNKGNMSEQEKSEITRISQEFSSGFIDTVGPIKGSGWLIADPLSGYLNACGFENSLQQIPASDDRPQVLIMTFKDGSTFIPAGSDLPIVGSKDWMWIDK